MRSFFISGFAHVFAQVLTAIATLQIGLAPAARATADTPPPLPTQTEFQEQISHDFGAAQKDGWDFFSIDGKPTGVTSILDSVIATRGLIFLSPVLDGIDARLPIRADIKAATAESLKIRIAVLDRAFKQELSIRTLTLSTADQKTPEAMKLRFERAIGSMSDEVVLKRSLLARNSVSGKSISSLLSGFFIPSAHADDAPTNHDEMRSLAARSLRTVAKTALSIAIVMFALGFLALYTNGPNILTKVTAAGEKPSALTWVLFGCVAFWGFGMFASGLFEDHYRLTEMTLQRKR